jgi:hypothetical protein
MNGGPTHRPDNYCAEFSTCSACMSSPQCGWCGASNTCLLGNFTGQDRSPVCVFWPARLLLMPCACLSGPSRSSCSSSWTYQSCGACGCSAAADCGSCLALPGCGWCQSTGTCQSGGLAGPCGSGVGGGSAACPHWLVYDGSFPNSTCAVPLHNASSIPTGTLVVWDNFADFNPAEVSAEASRTFSDVVGVACSCCANRFVSGGQLLSSSRSSPWYGLLLSCVHRVCSECNLALLAPACTVQRSHGCLYDGHCHRQRAKHLFRHCSRFAGLHHDRHRHPAPRLPLHPHSCRPATAHRMSAPLSSLPFNHV